MNSRGAYDQGVYDALAGAQRLGFLGDRPIAQVIEHARSFVDALERPGSTAPSATTEDGPAGSTTSDPMTVLDLGSGGGVPGLVIAMDRRDVRVTLLDRRAKRTDFLERMVSRLGWTDRVSVVCGDADTYTPSRGFDAVVARGFGPPEATLTTASRLVRSGGRIVISEPPDGDRWQPSRLDVLGLERQTEVGAPVVVFIRR